jgi:6-phosphogluconolactonase
VWLLPSMVRSNAVWLVLGSSLAACTAESPKDTGSPAASEQPSASATAPLNSSVLTATATSGVPSTSGPGTATAAVSTPSGSIVSSATTAPSTALPTATAASTTPSATASTANSGDGPPDASAPDSGTTEDFGTPVVYVGGYGGNFPLTTYDLDTDSGTLTARAATVDGGNSPSYLAVAPSGQFLYAANESDDASGGLTAFAIGADGGLTKLNHVTGSDKGFTFVAVDPTGKFALGASYNGGSVSVFPLAVDGTLGEELDSHDFGEGAQSHSVGFDPSGAWVFIPNKGKNEVAAIGLSANGMFSSTPPLATPTAGGAGPRHIAVRRDGSAAFVVNELNSTLASYSIAGGALTEVDTISTLPMDFNAQNSGAHVELSPDEQFVFTSNRGHNSLAVFSTTTQGELSLVEHEPCGGSTPRDFDVDPAGKVLIAANQDSDTLTVFRISDDGTLEALGQPVAAPDSPSAVQIVYLKP